MHPSIRTALDEIEGDPPRVDVALLEMLAEHAHAARDGDGAEGLARGQGYEVAFDHGFPPGHDGIALPMGLLVVRPSRDHATLMLRILHELAHAMLAATGWMHSHGDVWVLALALAVPRSLLMKIRARTVLDVAAYFGCAAWVAAARLDMTGITV